jgi:capsid protein
MILDSAGNPVTATRKFQHSAETNNGMRPWQPTRLADIDKLIPSYDRRTLVSASRTIVENFGPVKGAVRQIAMYSVGDAWKPKSKSLSERWRKKAEAVIREQFCLIADIRGGGRSLTDLLYHASVLLDRDGEVFVLLTEHKTGFPALQIIPSHRISSETSGDTVANGPFKGAKLTDGVICNAAGTVVGYRYQNDDLSTFTDLPANSVIHIFESDYPESKRGYPSISHGLNDIRDSMQSHEWERLNMLIRSSIALVENNEAGAPDDDMPGSHFDGSTAVTSPRDVKVNYLSGGAIRHYRAGTGSKIEVLKHENPGDMWSDYNDRMIRMTLAGIPWPQSLSWQATGQGTAERRDIEQARRTVKDRQSTLMVLAKRCVGYATAKLIKLGRIAASDDWWRWDFNMPPVLTIDDGRMAKAQIELWRAGLISDGDILADMGKDEEDYWPRKFEAAAKKELAFAAAQETNTVELDPRYKGMFTANDMGAESEAEPADTPDEPNQPDENDESDPD